MANKDSAFGMKAIGTISGSDFHGKMREVEFLAADSVAAFLGDPVKLTGTTGADGKTPVVAQAAAGDAIIGAIQSFVPNFSDEGTLSSTPNHRAASTARKAMVAFGSDVLYEIQEDSVGGALAAASAGQNVDLIIAAGSTITGASGVELDSSTAATTTATIRLHHLARDPDTILGNNANWVGSINENQDTNVVGV